MVFFYSKVIVNLASSTLFIDEYLRGKKKEEKED